MTENEAILIMQTEKQCVLRNIQGCDRNCKKCDLLKPDKEILEGYDMAISALKEIQQYREVDAQIKKIFDDQLGLVDIVKEYIEDIRRTHNGKTPRKVIALSEEDAQNWEDYKKIGTVEECWEAMEKQKAKKPKLNYKSKFFGKATYTCPKCGNACLEKFANERQNNNYCWDCGQAIRWEESEG